MLLMISSITIIYLKKDMFRNVREVPKEGTKQSTQDYNHDYKFVQGKDMYLLGRTVMKSFYFMLKQTLTFSKSCVNAFTAYHRYICVIICA